MLVDPLLPPPGSPDEARFFEALDRDVRALRAARPRRRDLSRPRARTALASVARYPAPRDDAGGEEDDRDPDEARD